MRVIRLKGEGFRNLQSLDFCPDENVNVICGRNAQGKTNLLEALWLFGGRGSFRSAKDSDFIAFGAERLKLELEFVSQGREQHAGIEISPQGKLITLGRVKVERMADLSEAFRAVVFAPDHLELVKQGPAERRRFLDSCLSAVYPKYAKVLDSYERILKQRGMLLSELRGKRVQINEMLDVWDEGLVQYGGYIAHTRARYVQRLAGYAQEVYQGLSSSAEKFSAVYKSGSGKFAPGASRSEVTAQLAKLVSESRGEDLRTARTNVGPHRDDFEVRLDGQSARSFGSQGQQRSCVLALKLAECKILQDAAEQQPIVLLDDVMSELDSTRRAQLLQALVGRQVIITCCAEDGFRLMQGGAVFGMSGGVLSAKQSVVAP